jgi:hypothetical protein
MNTQHTPGPWIGKNEHGKYNPDHTWRADDENKSNSETAAIWASGKVIALVVHSSNRFTVESDPSIDANASLIAAAPCLLDELRKARAALKEQLEIFIQSHSDPKTGLITDDADLRAIESDQDLINGIDRVIDQAEGGAA